MRLGIRSIAIFAAGAAAIALWVLFATDSDESASPSAVGVRRGSQAPRDASGESLRFDVARLRLELGEESRARRKLEGDLERLREELTAAGMVSAGEAAALSKRSGSAETESSLEAAVVSDLENGDSTRAVEGPGIYDLESSAEPPMFSIDALVGAGVSLEEAEALRSAWEAFSLDRLYLFDQATREGWRHKPRLLREAARLEHQIREEVGEDGWDRLLYASGEPNRVIVREVLEGSSAEQAGLRSGDVILRYDDRRVFASQWLEAMSARGRAGQDVPLEILRDGELVWVYVERGPLGTLLRNSRIAPEIQ